MEAFEVVMFSNIWSESMCALMYWNVILIEALWWEYNPYELARLNQ